MTPGKIETANNGTLMLDEIGDLPHSLQAKLLRFLQERVIERIGGRQEIPVNVRIVCATHQNLKIPDQRGTFPRGSVLSPGGNRREYPALARPLRRRALAGACLRAAVCGREQSRQHEPARGCPADDRSTRLAGNVRELENCIKRAVIMADGNQITADDIGLSGAEQEEAIVLDLRHARDDAERRVIITALARADGNVVRAAELLGVSRPTLYDMMHRFGLKK
jgi:two-component system NtrC family response regulator